MYPVLFTAFEKPVYAYVTMTVIGYVVGVFLGIYFGYTRDDRKLVDLFEAAVVVVLAAILGAKVFHVLFEAAGHDLGDGRIATGVLDLLRADPWHWARLDDPGYVFYGGVAGAVGFGLLFAVRRGHPRIGSAFDCAAPSFAFAIAVGRVGCYLGGCCHGTPTQLPWAVVFPAGHPSGGATIHPVQLYDVAFGLLAFVLILALWRRRRFGGEIFLAMTVGYAIWRFISEFFRGDADRGLWFAGLLSTSQLVSLAALPLAIFLWRRGLKEAGEKGPGFPPEQEVAP